MKIKSDSFAGNGFENELDLMRVLVNSTNDIFCIKDGEGRWLYANEEDLKLFELDGVDYRGKKDSELASFSEFYYDAFMACEDTDEQAWKNAVTSRSDEKIPLSSGGYRVFDVIKVPLFNDDRSRKNLVVVGRDITELVKERNYNNTVTSVLPDPFFVLDRDGVFIDYHDNNANKLLYSREQFIGNNIRDLFDDSVTTKYFIAAEKVFKNGGVESIEYNLKTISGDEYYTAQIVLLEENLLLVSIHDITKIRKTENELDQFKKTHLEILDSINEAVYILDENNCFVYVNKAAQQMYGYTFDEFIGKTPAFLSPEGMNDLEEVVEILRKAYEGEHQFFDFYGLTKDGHVFPKEVSSSPVMYHGKKAVISVARDVSLQKQAELDLKEARDKALESDKLKSSFLAILTHELRTPLNAVIGFSELMNSEAKDESISHYSKIIYDKGVDLLNIINDTLQMALIDAGEVELRHEAFKISDFIEEVKVVANTFDKHDGVELLVSSPTAEMDIVTDKTKLSQIMLNLIRNAIKFTDEGTISYGVKLFDDNAPYFFVEDTGTGISEEALGFIFQAFRQVEETISRSHGGLGLGLTISKELVSLLGGELKVKSEINKGSIFYFQIPGVVIS
jgi:PAS domain S-box-containing protein